MNKETVQDSSLITSLAAAVRTSDANGTGVDLQGYESAEVIAVVGPEGDTLSGSVFISLELEESSDNSTFTDVAAADMVAVGSSVTSGGNGQFALIDAVAEAPAFFRVAYIGTSRYIRVVDNVTGTHTNGTLTWAAVRRGWPRSAAATEGS